MSTKRDVGVAAVFGCVVFGLTFGTGASGREFHVSPSGDDESSGSRSRPFATLGRARDAIRHCRTEGDRGPMTVHVAGGLYHLNEPLVLTHEDSGFPDAPVLYTAAAGQAPVLSGGRTIGGWKRGGEGLWQTALDPVRLGAWRFRELFVNGRRATRARHPNHGFLRIDEAAPDQRSWFTFRDGDVPACSDAASVELILLHDWAVSRAPVARIDPIARKVDLRMPLGRGSWLHKMCRWEKHPRYYLENSHAFLDAPGEWHLDENSGILRYRPRPGERIDTAEFVAPAAERLLVLRGAAGPEGARVENVHFHGLTFAHCAFLIPSDGFYCGVQATFHFSDAGKAPRAAVPAAVEAEFAASCAFTECVFRQLGGGGIWLGRQCSGNRIEACAVSDVSGNGIMIGEPRERRVDGRPWLEAAPGQAARDNLIRHTLVDRCGRQFHGAVGIWSGIAARTSVIRCEVRNLPYTGISAGWKWDPSPTPCRETRIEGNHIHRVMGMLSDGGGIYTLGLQPKSSISRNLIHGVCANAGRAESNGMFLDQGTTDFTIEHNLIYDVVRSPLRFHQATINRVRRNHLVCAKGVPPIRYNRTETEAIKTEQNTVIEGSSPTPTEGVRGGALSFSGSQSLDSPHDDALDTPAFVLSAWVYLETYPRGRPSSGRPDRRTWVAAKNTNEWEDGHYGLVIKGDGAVGAYLNVGGGPRNTFSAFSADNTVRLNQWGHIAMRYDGTVLAVYVGGNRVAAEQVGRQRKPGKGPFCIGCRPDGYTHFEGSIDEVAYYDRALPASALEELALPGAVPPVSGRMGYWSMDEIPAQSAEWTDALARAQQDAGIPADIRQKISRRLAATADGQ